MIIRYRTYSFAVGTTTYTDVVANEFVDDVDQQGNFVKRRSKKVRRIMLKGMLQGADAGELSSKVNEFESAFSIDGGDFTVTSPSGVIVCSIQPSQTATGLRVTAMSYPENPPVEWVHRRTFQVDLECEIVLESANAGGVSGADEYSQQISYTGTGGPRFVVIPTMDGPPVKQELARLTPCFCTQQGQASGRARQLVQPAPIYPEHEHLDMRQISFDHKGGVSWQYFFEKTGPFG